MEKQTEKNSRLGSRIIEGLRDFKEALRKGEFPEDKFTIRHVNLDLRPNEHDAESVKLTRLRMGVSQSVFAAIVGVSVKQVEAWECGRRKPDQMACRLLDEINRNRKRWQKILRDSVCEMV